MRFGLCRFHGRTALREVTETANTRRFLIDVVVAPKNSLLDIESSLIVLYDTFLTYYAKSACNRILGFRIIAVQA